MRRSRTTYRTDVFERYGEEAESEISRIIAHNRNGSVSAESVADLVKQQVKKAPQQPEAQRDAPQAGNSSTHRAGQSAREAAGT